MLEQIVLKNERDPYLCRFRENEFHNVQQFPGKYPSWYYLPPQKILPYDTWLEKLCGIGEA